MIFRPTRDPERPVRHLAWRTRLFGIAAVLALAGIGADIEALRWAALAVLGVTAGLGFVSRRG
ncbi:MAG: hypothetical protein RQ745_05525 [Longimicrobiales bacterium]|nr:hypothetical protein [Longimicrobiales bacterium]